ncbi:MAG TPA: hypothetical protein VJA26_05035, partial [Gammaproteobacteria bacterium]|nr:hypothetical protein [Gammaproteobacteria bacterium]
MQRSYSPADVSLCMPYWVQNGDYIALMRTVGTFLSLYTDIEISLCDDGSVYGLTLPHFESNIRQVRLPAKDCALNPCVPINAAVWNATRPLVLLTNPGIEPVPGLLEALLAAHESDDCYVAAACRDVDSGRWLCHSTVRGGEFGRGPMPYGSGFHFCALFSRRLFVAAGGFDEDYREGQAYDDNDFLWRLHR